MPLIRGAQVKDAIALLEENGGSVDDYEPCAQ
jgi:hypothetical protein